MSELDTRICCPLHELPLVPGGLIDNCTLHICPKPDCSIQLTRPIPPPTPEPDED